MDTSADARELLNRGLRGMDLAGLPLRTRSKAVKSVVCKTLGYPVPKTFSKTKPRFLGQRFDTYTQQSTNLQVWNEKLESTRRYVIIRISKGDVIERVKVVTGGALAKLDTTGTLTGKYQARFISSAEPAELISRADTKIVKLLLSSPNERTNLKCFAPTDNPARGLVLPITVVFERLSAMVGLSFPDAGHEQERRRGADLHRRVCRHLGYLNYADDGRFPDVRHQLLEVKLQTSPTIDLGLVRPNSTGPLDMPKIAGRQLRHCDVRYALFNAVIDRATVRLTNFMLTTGVDFCGRFRQFRGKVLNKKLQIPLPADFFDR
ncbi:MAG: restriction endonuclease [Candidatus Binataceae bacterium]